MYSFPYLEPVCFYMSSSNCCFLTCIQISHETGKVVWYSHLFQNFPQFVVIHTVKGFGIVSKTEVDIFLELFCFFDDPTDGGNLISGSWIQPEHLEVHCSRTVEAWLGEFWALTLLVCEMSAIVWWFEHSLALPFFGIRMNTDLFQSCGQCWGFQICWHIECNTFTASSFRISNSLAGIPSPPLALFLVKLPKILLT